MRNSLSGEDAGPLAGILVADFSRVLSGPTATMILGDLGADVVKVERPSTGDDTRHWGPPWSQGESTYFMAPNRNKRSIQMDLADDEDRRLARRLAMRADVLVENFRPGVADRLGLGYAELAAENAGLVYASISGFGRVGKGAEIGGYDVLVQAMSGLMSVTGDPQGEPQKVGVALMDIICGLYTAIGIQAALLERASSQLGQRVHVSLMSSALASLANHATAYLVAGVVPTRMGNRHPSVAPYEVLATRDRPIVVAAGTDRLFVRMAEVLQQPELTADPRFETNGARVENRDLLVQELESVLRTRPAARWVEDLREHGVPAGLINGIEEAFDEGAALGLEPILESERTDGRAIRTVRSPLELSRTPVVQRHAPPTLGEHEHELREWLRAEHAAPLDDRG